LVTGRREEGIARESRNMLDDLCQIGLRGVWDKLVSEHREEGIAKSSRNLSDGLWGVGRGHNGLSSSFFLHSLDVVLVNPWQLYRKDCELSIDKPKGAVESSTVQG